MGETRVNLKHLLEDLRDIYPIPQEETIIVELIGNALDSGASQIRFSTDPKSQTMRVLDNGKGMTSEELEKYHDIAATTKAKGEGIGFAGVGAKLSLLIAKEIITETKCKQFHKATCWKLSEDSQKAPWEYIEPQGMISSPNGTAICIVVKSDNSNLLKPDFIEKKIQTHFYPILNQEFMKEVLYDYYRDGVVFYINERKIDLPEPEETEQDRFFSVQKGKKRKPIGMGFLVKSKEKLPEGKWGIAISTFGKVIKRGWDWIGISPRNPMQITGIVEIPELSKILTTNKMDFLNDAKSLQKYYDCRKAIQKELELVLQEFGEISGARQKPEKDLRPLEKEIEQVLENMLNDFPELNPLLGRKRKSELVTGIIPSPEASPIGVLAEGVDKMTGTEGGSGEGSGIEAIKGQMEGQRIEVDEQKKEGGKKHEGRRKLPGLMIGFEENNGREELGWLIESTIYINKGHPTYQRSLNIRAESYHIVLSVAWVLSEYLENEKSTQGFINRFLSEWGRA